VAETALYPPIKAFLESQGYTVKGEIGPCDVMAIRGEEPPVIVEIKEQLTLALILQAVDRLIVAPTVYIAFRAGKGHSASWRSRRKQVIAMVRRLGIGVLTVSVRNRVEAVVDPAPYKPRLSARRSQRLLKEFTERVGDPEQGGSASGQRMTAYRQDAIRCARLLLDDPELKLSVIREKAGVDRAGNILRDNHYGWFERVRVGHYRLSPRGRNEIGIWSAGLQ
jgi:hypothetical protein